MLLSLSLFLHRHILSISLKIECNFTLQQSRHIIRIFCKNYIKTHYTLFDLDNRLQTQQKEIIVRKLLPNIYSFKKKMYSVTFLAHVFTYSISFGIIVKEVDTWQIALN